MNILILTDLEGSIGLQKGMPYCCMKSYWKKTISAAIEAIKGNNNITNIDICNIHNNGNETEELKRDIQQDSIVFHKGITGLFNACKKCDVAMMVGVHGKSNSGGMFPHSFRTDIKNIFWGYNGKAVGEVFLFLHFFQLRRIPVVFVSGEGYFDDELSNHCCEKYIVSTDVDYQHSILCFQKSIKNAIQGIDQEEHYNEMVEHKKVYVEVDNKDKLQFLEEQGFPVFNGYIRFESVNAFFERIVEFAHLLRESHVQLVQRNIRCVKEWALFRDKILFDEKLHDVMNKPLELITSDDCKRVWESVLNNET